MNTTRIAYEGIFQDLEDPPNVPPVLGGRVMGATEDTIARVRRIVEGAERDARHGNVPDPDRWVSTRDARILLDAYDAATGNHQEAAVTIVDVRD